MSNTEEVVINEPYGFIYITTNMVNGKRYLGQRKFRKGWKTYLGSGTIFKQALSIYGKENFVRNIICICYSSKELNEEEYKMSKLLNIVEDDNWYNLMYGGLVLQGEDNPNYGKHPTEESIEKMRSASKGKKKSELHKKHIAESKMGDKNPMYNKEPWNKGIPQSDEVKEKNRQAHLGMIPWNKGIPQSEKAKEKNRLAHLGMQTNKAITVYQYDENLNLVHQWRSMTDAHNKTKINNISRACKDGKLCGGYYWRKNKI